MVDAIVGWDGAQSKRVHAFEATHVVAVLRWLGPALVMRVNAAVRAEIVLRCVRVELIELERFLALNNLDA